MSDHEARGRRNGWGCLRPGGISLDENLDEPLEFGSDHKSDYIRITYYGFIRLADDGLGWVRTPLGSPSHLSIDPITTQEASIILGSYRANLWLCERCKQQAAALFYYSRQLRRTDGDILQIAAIEAAAEMFEADSEWLKNTQE